MKLQTENIFQVVELRARPSDVYTIFLDAEDHTMFTGMKAEIEPIEGGEFSACNGRTKGHILKLVTNKRIIVAWTHKKFPTNQYSIVDIHIEKTEKGCRINFNHLAVPDTLDGWLTDNWMETYWEPLARYVEEKVAEAV